MDCDGRPSPLLETTACSRHLPCAMLGCGPARMEPWGGTSTCLAPRLSCLQAKGRGGALQSSLKPIFDRCIHHSLISLFLACSLANTGEVNVAVQVCRVWAVPHWKHLLSCKPRYTITNTDKNKTRNNDLELTSRTTRDTDCALLIDCCPAE